MTLNLTEAEQAKLQIVQEVELEMMSDLYNRLTNVCHRKCISSNYAEGELGKGEAVCIDRCVAKYLDIHDRIGKKLQNMQSEEIAKQN